MNVVKSSHYISKFALKNWAHPKTGEVTIFDFGAGTFVPEQPKKTYVADEAFPPDVETWLNTTIEDPLGAYLARCKKTAPPAGGEYQLPQPTDREWKAIRLWTMTQPMRTALAKDPSDALLQETVRKGDGFVEQLLAANEHLAASFVVFAARERLYFPEVGVVGLPLLGGVAFFVPLHPRIFAAVVPRTASAGAIERTLRQLGVASALSVGLKGDLVVIPPLQDGADLKRVEDHLRLARESARKLTSLILQQTSVLGMNLGDEWRPPPVVTPNEVADDDE